MALDTHISNASAAVMLDALVDLMEADTTSEIHVFVGAPNADAATTPAGQILAHLICSATAFGNATVASPSVATANAISSDVSADATGEAGCFWAGSVTTPDTMDVGIIQGTAGVSGDTPDLVFDDDMIVVGGTVAITAWTISMPTT